MDSKVSINVLITHRLAGQLTGYGLGLDPHLIQLSIKWGLGMRLMHIHMFSRPYRVKLCLTSLKQKHGGTLVCHLLLTGRTRVQIPARDDFSE